MGERAVRVEREQAALSAAGAVGAVDLEREKALLGAAGAVELERGKAMLGVDGGVGAVEEVGEQALLGAAGAVGAAWRTVITADGPFTVIVDLSGAVIGAGWVSRIDDVVARIRPEAGVRAERGGDGAKRAQTSDSAKARTNARASAKTDAQADGLQAAIDAVTRYYAGEYDAPMQIPVVLRGTDFQVRGFEELRRIAAGEPLSYAGFAAAMDRPAAVRAAASVCAKNAIGLFVPCHRVLRGDGAVGQFAWGAGIKESLLRREGH